MGYLGSQASALSLSPETERMIDEEIRAILEQAQTDAMAILGDNEAALHEIARVLQDQEVISGEMVAQILAEQPAKS